MFPFTTTASRNNNTRKLATTPRRDVVKSVAAVTAERLEGRQFFSTTNFDPGDTFQTAYDVGYLQGSLQHGETVNPTSDATDVYKFSMPRAGRFLGRVRAYNAPADVTLLKEVVNPNGTTQIILLDSRTANQAGPDAGSSSGNFAVKNLAAGNYYMVVQGLQGPTDYLVRMTSDFAGESIGKARELVPVVDEQYQDFVGDFGIPAYDDAADYYKVKMDAAGQLRVNVALENTDPQFFAAHADLIRDANNNGQVDAGELIQSSGAGTNVSIDRNLTAGTYFLRVAPDQGYSNYRLHLNADYAGSEVNQWRNAGGLGSKVFTDYIHAGSDRIDQYRFDGASNGALYVNFDGVTGSTAGLSLFHDTNVNGVAEPGELVNSVGSGEHLTMLHRTQGGPYILRVTGLSGGGKYTLVTDNRNDPSGNTLGLAQNLGTVNGRRTGLNEYTSSSDTLDYYKVTLGAAGTISAVLSPSIGNADLALIRDANGNGRVDAGETLSSSAWTGTQMDVVNKSVPAGTYFLRVNHASVSDVSKYHLSVTTDYAGQTAATARNVGTLAGTKTYDDWASQNYGGGGVSDVTDLYKFTLSSTRTLKARMTGVLSGEDLNLAVFQDKNNDGVLSANEQVASSTLVNTANEAISKSLAKGTYFVRVNGVNGDTNYKLTMSA